MRSESRSPSGDTRARQRELGDHRPEAGVCAIVESHQLEGRVRHLNHRRPRSTRALGSAFGTSNASVAVNSRVLHAGIVPYSSLMTCAGAAFAGLPVEYNSPNSPRRVASRGLGEQAGLRVPASVINSPAPPGEMDMGRENQP